MPAILHAASGYHSHYVSLLWESRHQIFLRQSQSSGPHAFLNPILLLPRAHFFFSLILGYAAFDCLCSTVTHYYRINETTKCTLQILVFYLYQDPLSTCSTIILFVCGYLILIGNGGGRRYVLSPLLYKYICMQIKWKVHFVSQWQIASFSISRGIDHIRNKKSTKADIFNWNTSRYGLTLGAALFHEMSHEHYIYGISRFFFEETEK